MTSRSNSLVASEDGRPYRSRNVSAASRSSLLQFIWHPPWARSAVTQVSDRAFDSTRRPDRSIPDRSARVGRIDSGAVELLDCCGGWPASCAYAFGHDVGVAHDPQRVAARDLRAVLVRV